MGQLCGNCNKFSVGWCFSISDFQCVLILFWDKNSKESRDRVLRKQKESLNPAVLSAESALHVGLVFGGSEGQFSVSQSKIWGLFTSTAGSLPCSHPNTPNRHKKTRP